MVSVKLGSTGIVAPKIGFGALPVQRRTKEDGAKLIRDAYECGVRFFDTARAYSDSEEKTGIALSDARSEVFICTKTAAKSADDFRRDLETSLSLLKTDYIDVYQFHNPSFCPRPGDGTGLYEAMLDAKEQGKIRHIGLTNHRITVALEAVMSGLYETLQFPFSYLATKEEEELVRLCKEKNVGFICMKALAGGLITRSDAAYAYISQFDNALPIFGIQRESELDEFVLYMQNPPEMTGELKRFIEHDREELSGDFCRGCGYCMPCPMGIEINTCARMSLLLRRSPTAGWLGERGQKMMKQIEKCIGCGKCKGKCPYGLDTPNLLKRNYEDYKSFLAEK